MWIQKLHPLVRNFSCRVVSHPLSSRDQSSQSCSACNLQTVVIVTVNNGVSERDCFVWYSPNASNSMYVMICETSECVPIHSIVYKQWRNEPKILRGLNMAHRAQFLNSWKKWHFLKWKSNFSHYGEIISFFTLFPFLFRFFFFLSFFLFAWNFWGGSSRPNPHQYASVYKHHLYLAVPSPPSWLFREKSSTSFYMYLPDSIFLRPGAKQKSAWHELFCYLSAIWAQSYNNNSNYYNDDDDENNWFAIALSIKKHASIQRCPDQCVLKS